MTSRASRRTAAGRVRRRALLVAVFVLLAAAAFAAPRHLLSDGEDLRPVLDGRGRAYLSTHGWPLRGQGRTCSTTARRRRAAPAAGADREPAPRGSVGRRRPRRRAAHRAGRPHGDPAAIGEQRRGDPSGFDDGTVSTALDQLRLARVVARGETLAAMMATRSHWLPVAGEVTNTNALLGEGGFVGMKTGSHEAAGGCLMFRAVWPTESGERELIGVVLGQRGGDLITAGLSAAEQLVDRLAPNTYRPHIENHIRPGNTPAS